jgi:hypothetical protein
VSDPNSAEWEYLNIYRVEVARSAFGSSGFGGVTIVALHNSPAKVASFNPVAEQIAQNGYPHQAGDSLSCPLFFVLKKPSQGERAAGMARDARS